MDFFNLFLKPIEDCISFGNRHLGLVFPFEQIVSWVDIKISVRIFLFIIGWGGFFLFIFLQICRIFLVDFPPSHENLIAGANVLFIFMTYFYTVWCCEYTGKCRQCAHTNNITHCLIKDSLVPRDPLTYASLKNGLARITAQHHFYSPYVHSQLFGRFKLLQQSILEYIDLVKEGEILC